MSEVLPPFLGKLKERHTEWFETAAGEQFRVMDPGTLDSKTKFLILLAVDAFAGSTGVAGIAHQARDNGATEA